MIDLGWHSREITYIAISASLWSVINALLSPYFFAATRLPFLCDFLGVLALMLVTWKVRKFGAATSVGIISTFITLSLNPNMVQFLGFGIASIVFDVICFGIGYSRIYDSLHSALAVVPAVAMAFTGGVAIGLLFMAQRSIEFALWWGGLHAVGGAIGGIVGAVVLNALGRRISVNGNSYA